MYADWPLLSLVVWTPIFGGILVLFAGDKEPAGARKIALVVSIISRHVPGLGEGAVQTRSSSGGKYLSVTVTFEAGSKAQLDEIYQSLTDHERVLMSL